MAYLIETFPCPNGHFMRWARLDATGTSKGCVLIGLGWGEWLEKYAPIAEEWRRRGFDCVLLEWRGQGLSSRFMEDRSRAWHASFDPLVEDLDAFVAWYFENDPGPLLLMGHSLGAHLLLRWYVEKNPPFSILKGVILLSPMQQVKTAPFELWLAELIAGTAVTFGLGKRWAPGQRNFDPVNVPYAGNTITRDEARYGAMMLALRENAMLKCGGITYGWLDAAFRSAKRLEKRLRLGAPRGPYLLLGPENDPLVETSGMKKLAALLPNCISQFVPGAAHELLQETDPVRNSIWAAIDAFVKKLI